MSKLTKIAISLCISIIAAVCWAGETVTEPALSNFFQQTGVDKQIASRMLNASPQTERKRSLPKKIVMEVTLYADPKADNSTMMTVEQLQKPIAGGLVNTARLEKRKSGKPLQHQAVSYLGIIDLGTTTSSAQDVATSIAGAGAGFAFILPVVHSMKYESTSGIKVLETNLEKIENPILGEKWPLSITNTVQLQIEGQLVSRSRTVQQELAMECSSTEQMEAKSVHPGLGGPARLVVCEGKAAGGQQLRRHYAFLEDYLWYLLLKSEAGNGRLRTFYSIREVEP